MPPGQQRSDITTSPPVAVTARRTALCGRYAAPCPTRARFVYCANHRRPIRRPMEQQQIPGAEAMPEKNWEELSLWDKVEDLRREVLNLREAFDRLADGAVSRTSTMVTITEFELGKFAKRLDALEADRKST